MLVLDPRLSLCASFVRDGTRLADIGTDHAYLPVWLALEGRISSAVAADLRKGPLMNAEESIKNAKAEHIVTTRLSDGLDEISPDEAYDIVMAGMGGELIAKLIGRTDWLRDKKFRLILQPMTRAHILREYLSRNGFRIIEEKACISHKKSYSVMCCEYDGVEREADAEFLYFGLLSDDSSAEAEAYRRVITEKLRKKLRGIDPQSPEHGKISKLILS